MTYKIKDTGIVYRNPRPHVVSKQAYFPWLVPLQNGELLCSFVIGEAFESVDLDTYLVRSRDVGKTWSSPKRMIKKDESGLNSRIIRLAPISLDKMVGILVKSIRDEHPEDGLANPENIGFVPTDVFLIRSEDLGKTWKQSKKLVPPLIGPSFEACSPIVVLSDGRWLWPTSTWRGWEGDCPNGMKMICWISYDKGKTWPEYMDVMDGSNENIIYWEGKVIEAGKNTLLAVAWSFDENTGKDLANHYAISRNGGKTWSEPQSTGLFGQTMDVTKIDNKHFLIVYRRIDKPGLWLVPVRFKNDNWISGEEIPLWGVDQKGLTSRSDNMVYDFNNLRFGAPCITVLPDGSVYVVFWCYENYTSNIRWIKVKAE